MLFGLPCAWFMRLRLDAIMAFMRKGMAGDESLPEACIVTWRLEVAVVENLEFRCPRMRLIIRPCIISINSELNEGWN